MAINLIGAAGAVAEVDPTFDALRASLRPAEAQGVFRLGKISGLTTGLAANGVLFTLRNPDASKLIILQYLKVRAAVITGFTAAQEIAFDVLPHRSWTVAPSGGTAVAINQNNLKKRTALSVSIADIRIATTGVLTLGTATADAETIMAGTGKTLAAAATVQDVAIEEEYDATGGSEYPIVLAQNEGLAVRNTVLLGAGGTVRWAITAGWLENPTY